jgi:hypothetical protein
MPAISGGGEVDHLQQSAFAAAAFAHNPQYLALMQGKSSIDTGIDGIADGALTVVVGWASKLVATGAARTVLFVETTGLQNPCRSGHWGASWLVVLTNTRLSQKLVSEQLVRQ